MKKVSKFSKGWKIGTAIFSTCLVAGAGVGIYFGVVAPRTDSTDPGKDDPIVDPVDPIDPDDPTERYSAEQKSALIAAFEKAVGVDGEVPERGTSDYADYSLLKKLAQSVPGIFDKCNITSDQLNSVVNYLAEGERIFASYDILSFLSVEDYTKTIKFDYYEEDVDKTIVDLNLRVNFFDFVTETLEMLNGLIHASEQVNIGIDVDTMASIYTSLLGQALEYRVEFSDLFKRGNSSDLITKTDDLTNIEEKLAEKYGANGTAYANMYTEFAKVYIKHAIADKVDTATTVSAAINAAEGTEFATKLQNYIKGLNADNVNKEEYKLVTKISEVTNLAEYVERIAKYLTDKNVDCSINLGTDFNDLISECKTIYANNINKGSSFASKSFNTWLTETVIPYYYKGEETELSPELFSRVNRWFDISRNGETKGLAQGFDTNGIAKLRKNFNDIFGSSAVTDCEDELVEIFNEFIANFAGDMNQYFTEVNDLFIGTLSIFENSVMSFLSNNYSKYEGAVKAVLTAVLDSENIGFSIAKALDTEDFVQSIKGVLEEKITEKTLAVKISEKLQTKVENMKGKLKEKEDGTKALIATTKAQLEKDVNDLLYGFRGTFGMAYNFGIADIEGTFYDLIKTIENSPKYIMQYIDIINDVYDGAIAAMEYIADYDESEEAYNISDYFAEFYIAFIKDVQEEKRALADLAIAYNKEDNGFTMEDALVELLSTKPFGSRTKALITDGRLPLLLLKTAVAFIEGTGIYKSGVTSEMTVDQFLSENKTLLNAIGFTMNVFSASDKLDYLAHITDEQIAKTLVKEIPAGSDVVFEYDNEKKTYTLTYKVDKQEDVVIGGITKDYLVEGTINDTAKTAKTAKVIARTEDDDINTIIPIVLIVTQLFDEIKEMSFINEETDDFYTLGELVKHFIPTNILSSEIIQDLVEMLLGKSIDELIDEVAGEALEGIGGLIKLDAGMQIPVTKNEDNDDYTLSIDLSVLGVDLSSKASELGDIGSLLDFSGKKLVLDIPASKIKIINQAITKEIIGEIPAGSDVTYESGTTENTYKITYGETIVDNVDASKISLILFATTKAEINADIPANSMVMCIEESESKYKVILLTNTEKNQSNVEASLLEFATLAEVKEDITYPNTIPWVAGDVIKPCKYDIDINDPNGIYLLTWDYNYETYAAAEEADAYAGKTDLMALISGLLPTEATSALGKIEETIDKIADTVERYTSVPVDFVFSTILPYVFVDYIIEMPQINAYGTDFYDLAKIFAYDLIVDGLNGENVGEKLRNVIGMYILYGIGNPINSIEGLPTI